jgi:hypothetical protein
LLDELQFLSVNQFGNSAYGSTIFAITALGLIGTVPFMTKAGSLFDQKIRLKNKDTDK